MSKDLMATAARSSAAAAAGAVVAAGAGFLLNVLIGRALGVEGAGLVFTGIAITSILIFLSTMGAETGLVWALPRARTLGRGGDTLRVMRWAFGPIALLSLALGVVLWTLAPTVATWIGDPGGDATAMVRTFALGVVVGGPTLAAVQATRALGGILPFVLLQQVSLPIARVAGVLVVVVATAASVEAVAWGWVVPLMAVGLVAALTARSRARRVVATSPPSAGEPTSVRGFWRYSLRRWLASVGSQVLTWSDVVIVAALTSPSVAGVYAAASRFATTGRIALEATRLAIGPQVSQAFARRSIGDVSVLGEMSAVWAVALSWPLYLIMATFGQTLLSVFGPGFSAGAVPLAIVSTGMLFAVGTGAIGMIINMSGRSGLLAINVWSALAVNVTLNLVLVPAYGATGAAVAWVAALVVENTLGLVQTRGMGVRAHGSSFWVVAGIVLAVTAVIAGTSRAAFGDSWTGLAVAVIGVVVVLTPTYVRLRGRLHLEGILRRPAPPAKAEAASS